MNVTVEYTCDCVKLKFWKHDIHSLVHDMLLQYTVLKCHVLINDWTVGGVQFLYCKFYLLCVLSDISVLA